MTRSVRQLHEEAMRLSQEAVVARVRGDYESQRQFVKQALMHEVMAAEQVPFAPESEPTRSILYRSAASLAFQAQDFEYTLRLIGEALRGYPPPSVIDELTSLWSSVQHQKYLEDSGIVSIETGVEIRIAGPVVGNAQIPYGELDQRIDALTMLTDRSTDFLQNKDFSRRRPRSNALGLRPTLSNVRPGSFIADINFQADAHQLSLFTTIEDVISLVIDSVEKSDAGDIGALISLFRGNESYAANANKAVMQLAPDGQGIREVTVTTSRKNVTLDTPSAFMDAFTPSLSKEEPESSRVLTAIGNINQPDRQKDTIDFLPEDGSKPIPTIYVHEALVDFVLRYWPERVEIEYRETSKQKELLDIRVRR